MLFNGLIPLHMDYAKHNLSIYENINLLNTFFLYTVCIGNILSIYDNANAFYCAHSLYLWFVRNTIYLYMKKTSFY